MAIDGFDRFLRRGCVHTIKSHPNTLLRWQKRQDRAHRLSGDDFCNMKEMTLLTVFDSSHLKKLENEVQNSVHPALLRNLE
jgi:hypothetical protein